MSRFQGDPRQEGRAYDAASKLWCFPKFGRALYLSEKVIGREEEGGGSARILLQGMRSDQVTRPPQRSAPFLHQPVYKHMTAGDKSHYSKPVLGDAPPIVHARAVTMFNALNQTVTEQG